MKFIEFFLRLIYAKPCELGWDETIRRIEPTPGSQESIQYDIQVEGKTYRTSRIISNIGADALRGRGTRVWEVKEVSSTTGEAFGSSLVLKDCWVDVTREREGVILNNIRESIEVEIVEMDITMTAEDNATGQCAGETLDERKEIYKRVLASGLPEVIAYGDVMVDGVPDDTHSLMRRGVSLGETTTLTINLTDNKKTTSHRGAVGALHALAPQRDSPLKYGAKVHHRTVFSKVGRSLAEVTSLAAAFGCLADIALGRYDFGLFCDVFLNRDLGLKVLHECGWVHRDISCGNILLIGKGGMITDVEFTKADNASTYHSIRTASRSCTRYSLPCTHDHF